jgi:hypothetical protein
VAIDGYKNQHLGLTIYKHELEECLKAVREEISEEEVNNENKV